MQVAIPHVAQAAQLAAILEADELVRFTQVLAYLENQMGLVQRARTAFAHAEFLARCLDLERVRVWRGLCEAHGLDPEAEYKVDGAGLVVHIVRLNPTSAATFSATALKSLYAEVTA